MIVKIESYFKNYFDLKKQTPNSAMKWGNITFTCDDVEECDYLVILDYPEADFAVKVNKNNIIHICLEPPNEVSKYRLYCNKNTNYLFCKLVKFYRKRGFVYKQNTFVALSDFF